MKKTTTAMPATASKNKSVAKPARKIKASKK
jgi:hypothetical protein